MAYTHPKINGDLVRECRERKQLKQIELAARCKISQPCISRIEGGYRETVSLMTLCQIAKELDIKLDDLVKY
jgi:transcriptional regulator with XRE-family HTH domain